MKKFVMFLAVMSMLFSAFAVEDTYRSQKIFGYIDDLTYLYVSPFKYAGSQYQNFYGIDLDYNDESNGFRYQIMPSAQTRQPGLQIGTFSLLATFMKTARSANLVVSHTKLINETDSSAMLEYDLAIMYSFSDGAGIYNPGTTKNGSPYYCYSTGTISVPMTSSSSQSIATIMDGNIYFRLVDAVSSSTTPGQYSSTVTFSLVVQ